MESAQLKNLSLGRLRYFLNKDLQKTESKKNIFNHLRPGSKMWKQSMNWLGCELDKLDVAIKTSKKIKQAKVQNSGMSFRTDIIDQYTSKKLRLVARIQLSIPN